MTPATMSSSVVFTRRRLAGRIARQSKALEGRASSPIARKTESAVLAIEAPTLSRLAGHTEAGSVRPACLARFRTRRSSL